MISARYIASHIEEKIMIVVSDNGQTIVLNIEEAKDLQKELDKALAKRVK